MQVSIGERDDYDSASTARRVSAWRTRRYPSRRCEHTDRLVLARRVARYGRRIRRSAGAASRAHRGWRSAPLALFFASLRLSRSFRDFVLSLDLRLIAAIQAWRWAGLGFLSLYAHKVLPAVFAFPAGLGDMAIGVTAPWIMLALLRNPGFAARGAFIRWNILGILDLVIAISIGTVSALLATEPPEKSVPPR